MKKFTNIKDKVKSINTLEEKLDFLAGLNLTIRNDKDGADVYLLNTEIVGIDELCSDVINLIKINEAKSNLRLLESIKPIVKDLAKLDEISESIKENVNEIEKIFEKTITDKYNDNEMLYY